MMNSSGLNKLTRFTHSKVNPAVQYPENRLFFHSKQIATNIMGFPS